MACTSEVLSTPLFCAKAGSPIQTCTSLTLGGTNCTGMYNPQKKPLYLIRMWLDRSVVPWILTSWPTERPAT